MKKKLTYKSVYWIASIPILIVGYLYLFTVVVECLRAPSDIKVLEGVLLFSILLMSLIKVVQIFKNNAYE